MLCRTFMAPRVCQKPDNGHRAYQMQAMDGFLGRPLNPGIFLISQLPPPSLLRLPVSAPFASAAVSFMANP